MATSYSFGEDEKFNQNFSASTHYMHYFLAFTVVPGAQDCSDNADIVVAEPDSKKGFFF